MKLTDKCLEDFEMWYKKPLKEHVGLRRLPQWFYTLTDSMQYGVYIDFFDRVGIIIEIQVHVEPTMQGGSFKKFKAVILNKGRFVNTLSIGSSMRERIREQAIIKANEIYNSQ